MKRKKKQCFSDVLKNTMDRKKISVRKLSEMSAKEGQRIPPSTISAWRNGAIGSDYHALKTIAKCLGISLSYLLTGEEEVRSSDQTVEEMFEEGEIVYSGYAKVSVLSLIPRKKTKDKS